MNNKNIKRRYNDAINAFKSRIQNQDKSKILKIESIENEYSEYNKKLKDDKINLGMMILSGTVITAAASAALFLDTDCFELELAKEMIFILGGALGAFMIPVSIENYQKDRLNSNIEANKKLKEYEEIIEKGKVNVKKR